MTPIKKFGTIPELDNHIVRKIGGNPAYRFKVDEEYYPNMTKARQAVIDTYGVNGAEAPHKITDYSPGTGHKRGNGEMAAAKAAQAAAEAGMTPDEVKAFRAQNRKDKREAEKKRVARSIKAKAAYQLKKQLQETAPKVKPTVIKATPRQQPQSGVLEMVINGNTIGVTSWEAFDMVLDKVLSAPKK